MMKTRNLTKALIVLCLLSIQTLFAQTPILEWVQNFGGTSQDRGHSIAIDVSGNIYTTGSFEGTADFNPGLGNTNFTAGGRDIFVQKLDNNGNFLWAKHLLGTPGPFDVPISVGESIALDNTGNLYITGLFSGTVDFNPGTGIANRTSIGGSDIYILKLDPNGNFLWVKQMGGTDELHLSQYGKSIAVDSVGNVYTTGCFQETMDFDPGEGIANLNSAGYTDIFIQKLDTNGDFIWAKRIGGNSSDSGQSIALDAAGKVYVTGYFMLTADFDPGTETANLIATGAADIFVLKMAPNGGFIWAKQFGGGASDVGQSIAVDDKGNVYTTGGFFDAGDFNPGLGTANLISAGNTDIFLQKLDANGNYLWAKQIEGSSNDFVGTIALDSSGNIYTTGAFQFTTDFNPEIEEFNFVSAGGVDVFVQKLDANGVFLWAKHMGGDNSDYGSSIAVDASGNVYTTGFFKQTANFDLGVGSSNITSTGHYDVFVQKLSQCNPTTHVPDVEFLPPLTGEYSVYPTSPTAFNGCVTLTGTSTTTFPITAQGTTTLIWIYNDGNGNVSTQLQDVIINIGNPPLVMDVANLPDLTAICVISANDVRIPTATDFVVGIISASPDFSFPITDKSISQIVWTYDNGNGQVLSQTQTINWITIDITTALNGLTITASNGNGTYQWVDCDNDNMPFAGEVSQSFTPKSNGNYAVQIIEDGCMALSDCVSIMTLGKKESEFKNKWDVYPNPSSDIFNIEFEEVIENAQLTITDIQGRLISSTQIQNTARVTLELNNAPGLYLLRIRTKEGQKTVQLIKD